MNKLYWNTGTPPVQLIEECAEVIHIICKGERFGWNNFNPYDCKKLTNYSAALNEIEDLEKRIIKFKQWVADKPFKVETERGEG